jgi:dTDP-4-dehydrorhamnose reductase
LDIYRSVVITGAGGMLAHEFDKSLAARGATVHLARRADCDVTDNAQLSRMFQQHRPTLLLNCAAHTGVDACETESEKANAINGDGPRNLAQLCLEYRTQLIHFSTDFVFDGQSDRPYRPNDIPNPLSAYGKSKLLGEQGIMQTAPPSWLIIRTAWLFGRHGNCFPRAIIDRARKNLPLEVVNDQIGCPTYAVDLAWAVLKLIDHGCTGIWHLSNSSSTNWFEFSKAILTEFNISKEVKSISTEEWKIKNPGRANRPKFSVLEQGELEVKTGIKMRDWRETLRDYRTECENC